MGVEMSNEYVSSGSLNHAEGKSGNNVNLKREDRPSSSMIGKQTTQTQLLKRDHP